MLIGLRTNECLPSHVSGDGGEVFQLAPHVGSSQKNLRIFLLHPASVGMTLV